MGPMVRRTRTEDGAVATEFAILLPILCMLVFGIVFFGIAVARMVSYVSAAREGARFAAVHCAPQATSCSNALIAQRVRDAAAGNPIGPGSPSANRDCAAAPGQPVTVSWTQDVPIEIPFLPDLSFQTTISGTFRCE
jgi:Flp pilus assembly protein TadG